MSAGRERMDGGGRCGDNSEEGNGVQHGCWEGEEGAWVLWWRRGV